MKKKQIYVYLAVSIFILIASIVLFVLDESPAYYAWTYTAFFIGCILAFGSLSIALIYIRKNKFNELTENIIEWFRFLGMSLMFILIFFMFFFTSATVDGASMEETLQDGNVVFIYHYNYEPRCNDIIIIHITTEQYPNHQGEEDYYVKRIYGVPGDTVTFEYDSPGVYKILVNDEIVVNQYGQEYYARTNTNSSQMTIANYTEREMIQQLLDDNSRIKEGCYLALGDNEHFSLDSRDLGLIHKEDIIGEVIFKISPFGGVS